MPLYEYQCENCGKRQELRHPADLVYDEPCAECGGQQRRLFFPAAVHFVGSGWHVTDYADKKPSESKSEEKTSESKEPSKPASSDSAKSEPKKD